MEKFKHKKSLEKDDLYLKDKVFDNEEKKRDIEV